MGLRRDASAVAEKAAAAEAANDTQASDAAVNEGAPAPAEHSTQGDEDDTGANPLKARLKKFIEDLNTVGSGHDITVLVTVIKDFASELLGLIETAE